MIYAESFFPCGSSHFYFSANEKTTRLNQGGKIQRFIKQHDLIIQCFADFLNSSKWRDLQESIMQGYSCSLSLAKVYL